MGLTAAIAGSAILGAGTSLAAGSQAAGAAKDAAATQSAAANYAATLQYNGLQQTRNDLSPFLRAGTGGLNYLSTLIPGGIRLSDGSNSAGNGPPSQASSNNQYTTVDFGDGQGPQTVANPNYDPTQPTTAPNAGNNFQLDQGGGQSPFLSGLENMLPGGSDPSLKGALSVLPGGSSSLGWAEQSYIPGSGVYGNPLLSNMLSLTPGNNGQPQDPTLANLGNFINGGSATPDNSLLALRSFVPGASENPLLQKYNNLLGVEGGDVQAALESTPGYQFTRDQGLMAVQNGFAAKGLANSGAALKGAASFASGLANSTYEQRLADYAGAYQGEYNTTSNAYNTQFANNLNAYDNKFANSLNAYNTSFTNTLNTVGQAFNNNLNAYNSQFTNAYNAYGQQLGTANNLVTLGSNAGARVGTIAQDTNKNIGNNLTSAGAATASGIVGASNASTNALTGAASTIGNAGITLAGLGRTQAAQLGGNGGILTSAG